LGLEAGGKIPIFKGMPDGTPSLAIRVIDSLKAVRPEDWNSCAGSDNPFLSHAFLSSMEQSGSACPDSGWSPHHLLAEDEEGRLLACAPLYLKTHSYGEYVFDWSWAEAWQRSGRAYYPKLQCAVPFTPATGPRLLIRPESQANAPALMLSLGGAMSALCERAGLSSAHVTFLPEDQAVALAGQGWLLRTGMQYHWHNDGYDSFDGFLAALSSRKRKSIRKEREQAQRLGLTIRTLSGDDIKPHHWDAFYRFYLDTVEKKWAHAYLNREFFHHLGQSMSDKVVLVMAEMDGTPVAGALNLRGGDTLYGRNWGSEGDFRFLHFEMCYYRAIDYAIAHGLKRVEAGAQGEHKISRGYLPSTTYSVHWIREESLRRSVSFFLEKERLAVSRSMAELAELSPFRQEDHGAEGADSKP
jgi:predicted N-acyltransferase